MIQIEHNGKRQHVSAWARDLGVHPNTVATRIRVLGWEPERAVSEPPQQRATLGRVEVEATIAASGSVRKAAARLGVSAVSLQKRVERYRERDRAERARQEPLFPWAEQWIATFVRPIAKYPPFKPPIPWANCDCESCEARRLPVGAGG